MGELTLKQWMGLKEVTIQKLSEDSGVSVATIANIRSGKVKPNIETLKKIASALDVKIDDIAV